MTAISLKGVSKSYSIYPKPHHRLVEAVLRRKCHDTFHALRPLNLAVDRGEVIGIIGRNGVGKSTLLKLIAGTLEPTHGEIEVNGRISALLELGTGFHPDISGRDNVYFSGAVKGISKSTLADRFDEIVEFAELWDCIDRPVKTYSSGMTARLAFAVATSVKPDVLIVDEILSVGDGAFARKSFDRIMEFKDGGSTILFCSHSLHQVESVCSRVLWLDQGELRMEGDPKTLIAAYSQSLLPAAKASPETDGESLTDEPSPPEAEKRSLAWIDKISLAVDGVVGSPARLESTQSNVTLFIEFLSGAETPVPSVGVIIATDQGFSVTSAGSVNDDIRLERDETGRTKVELTFPQFALLKGRYRIDVYLLCERGIHVYDYAFNAAQLEVSQQGLDRGLVSLPRKWAMVE